MLLFQLPLSELWESSLCQSFHILWTHHHYRACYRRGRPSPCLGYSMTCRQESASDGREATTARGKFFQWITTFAAKRTPLLLLSWSRSFQWLAMSWNLLCVLLLYQLPFLLETFSEEKLYQKLWIWCRVNEGFYELFTCTCIPYDCCSLLYLLSLKNPYRELCVNSNDFKHFL